MQLTCSRAKCSWINNGAALIAERLQQKDGRRGGRGFLLAGCHQDVPPGSVVIPYRLSGPRWSTRAGRDGDRDRWAQLLLLPPLTPHRVGLSSRAPAMHRAWKAAPPSVAALGGV